MSAEHFQTTSAGERVTVRITQETIPTYLPAAPDRNPMFLEKRVYQGSSGRVYPLPFTDRIAETRTDRLWKAVWIENEYLRVLILPELGGRIHALQDKTNGYEAIYRQEVIKPALVGLAGPWASGGIEFNWPQHHRPATFLPMDVEIEKHPDGSKTVWCSDHDPVARMKGMHGLCLHPGKAFAELKVRAYNRTPFVQTFLWWANVATCVHEAYQSFFPPDVYYVADHAKRAMAAYPLCEGQYYGVNYGERGRRGIPEDEVPRQYVPPHCGKGTQILNSGFEIPAYVPNDLSFYANIPTPCSYMCMGSREDFFGGYDYLARAGLVHYANHHITPGKKQWTWGNHDFGYAWDRNLTDPDPEGRFRPYIEIMAGVYTDNQPDFSFLQPGETKSWSQYWYPIQQIGPAQHANLDAAISLRIQAADPARAELAAGRARGGASRPVSGAPSKASAFPRLRLGLCVTSSFGNARVRLEAKGSTLATFTRDLGPGVPLVEHIELPRGTRETDLRVVVTDSAGRGIISYQPQPRGVGKVPPSATEPLPPTEVSSADELYITGLHLDQYRHATRSPVLYWREALRRDPLDSRCNNAMGLWHLRRGEFEPAEACFRKAIERLTRRNPNPYDGEPYYNLGLCLRHQLDASLKSQISNLKFQSAYDAFYKATWNEAWAGAGYHALAEMDCRRRDWSSALDHLDRSLRHNTDNTRARDLKAMVLRRLGGGGAAGSGSLEPSGRELSEQADTLLRETLALDPLDAWARWLLDGKISCDAQARLDIAHDLARAGFYAEAIVLLSAGERIGSGVADNGAMALPDQNWGAVPLVHYTLGWLHEQMGEDPFGDSVLAAARRGGNGLPRVRAGRPAGRTKAGPRKKALREYQRAAAQSPDYCFPARLEEIVILESAMRANPGDDRAPYYLGNLLYDRRRHAEAITLWERSARLNPRFPVVWRNLGIGYFNVRNHPARAKAAYDRAFRANPEDARVLYERDQLWKRLGESPAKRLRELERHPGLARSRDDLSIELCALYNQTGQHSRALEFLKSRKFQPWEGGEGGPLGQHVRTHLGLGRIAMIKGEYCRAQTLFETALSAPENLGEARHILANQSDIHYWLGSALSALGDRQRARREWLVAATFKGDFQEMSVREFSEMTYYSARAWERLGRKAKARRLLRRLLDHALRLEKSPAKIEYFATSLPTMLLFDDDLQVRQKTAALFLQAQAWLGLGDQGRARTLLRKVLQRDPNHPLAADLLTTL